MTANNPRVEGQAAYKPKRHRWFGCRFYRKTDASKAPVVRQYGVHLWFGVKLVDLSVCTAVLDD